MKKLFLLLLVVTSVMAMSCGTSDTTKEQIVDDYLFQTEYFDLKITYFNDSYYKDSSHVTTATFLVFAYDVYDAQRMCEELINEYDGKFGVISTDWVERRISKHQSYPYNK